MPHPVLFVAIDGLRPEALSKARCPNLNALRERGAYALRVRSVMPSISLPCFMSIFHGMSPEHHGVTSNRWQPMPKPVPGLVDLAHFARLRCGFIHNWEPLRDLNRPGGLSFSYFRDNLDDGPPADLLMTQEAVRYITGDRPDFTFVYLGTPDIAGHDHGWMSAAYLDCLEKIDPGLGMLIAALPEDGTIIVGSDHGGHDTTHGSDAPEDMTVPLVLAGPGIRRGYEITTPVSIMDIAPTIVRLLNLSAPAEWEGRCIDEAFL